MLRSERDELMTPEERILWDIYTNQAERRYMDIKNGRRKSFNIEYVEVTAENLAEAAKWGGGVVEEDEGTPYVKIIDKNAINTRQTKAFVGDFIVHHLELKTFKSFSKKAFAKAFEEVREAVLSRDAATGEIVTEQFAHDNPSTTVTEHMTVGIPQEEPDEEPAADGIDPKLLGTTELPHDADPS